MARGYPDFFGVSVFPFYGAPQLDQFIDVGVPAAGTVTLHALTIKGQIAGGYMRVTTAHDLANYYLSVYFDGVRVFYLNLYTVMYHLHMSDSWPLRFTQANYEDDWFTLGYVKGYPWGNAFRVDFQNASGAGVRVLSDLTYYVVRT